MLVENQYKVKTDWGWITLDEASYRDYLEGKLWISTPRQSGTKQTAAAAPQPRQTLPARVSEEALRFRDLAARNGIYPVLQQLCPGGQVELPYRTGMSETRVEEMNLSARSVNCLMRAGASSFGRLYELMTREQGLRGIRNLGAKSEKEIRREFFSACYARLSPGEQARYWQKTLDGCRQE